VRGLGWDIDSSFSSNRGELLPIGSFGHTGFTGHLDLDRSRDGMFVVFLSNRLHPDGKGDVTPLRARVATIAASAAMSVPRTMRRRRRAGRDFGPPAPAAGAARGGAGADGIDVLRARASACCGPRWACSPTTRAARATAPRRST
jgi:transposase InsO family protein